jgi:hypothetical protein
MISHLLLEMVLVYDALSEKILFLKNKNVNVANRRERDARTGRGIQGGRRRPQAARPAGGPPPKPPYGRLGGGPPAGRIRVGHGGPR